jgi:hypothetical protein
VQRYAGISRLQFLRFGEVGLMAPARDLNIILPEMERAPDRESGQWPGNHRPHQHGLFRCRCRREIDALTAVPVKTTTMPEP